MTNQCPKCGCGSKHPDVPMLRCLQCGWDSQSTRQTRLDQRLANQLDEEQQQRESVRPIGPRPWSNKPASGPAQLDLTGQPITPPPPPSDPPPRPVPLQLPVTVARSYRSKAWGGTVTEPPLPEPGPPDMTPDDHNRPAYLGPIGPHHCPGPATCKQRWLTDDEMENEEPIPTETALDWYKRRETWGT